jgi:hypothetical protein
MKCDATTQPPGGALPPDPIKCVTSKAVADCGPWTPVGPVLKGGQTPPQIASTGDQSALFTWESGDGSTLCMYLPRIGNACAPGGTLNGVLCFNTTTCEACAYDKCQATTAGKIGDLNAAPTGMDNCSSCHLAGPVLPLKPLFTSASPSFSTLQNTCIAQGGPTWVQAATWLKPNKGTVFTKPVGCTKSCHDGFRPAPDDNYCSTILNFAFGPGGAMQGKFNPPATPADCVGFTNSVGCSSSCATICTASVTGKACKAAADCCSGNCAADGTCQPAPVPGPVVTPASF